jgi:hypothetical protein
LVASKLNNLIFAFLLENLKVSILRMGKKFSDFRDFYFKSIDRNASKSRLCVNIFFGKDFAILIIVQIIHCFINMGKVKNQDSIK